MLGSWLGTQNLWGAKSVLFRFWNMGKRKQCENQRVNALNVYTSSFSKGSAEVCWDFTVKFLMVCLHIYVIVFCKNVKILACSLCPFCSVWLNRNEELNDLYSSPSTFRVIKSRRIRWAGNVARMGEGWGLYRVLVGKPEGNPGVDGRVILRYIFR